MGYRKPARHFKLSFEDEEYNGLEVIVKSLTIGKLLEVSSLTPDPDSPNQDVEATEKLLHIFADNLVSWNLEDEDGNPYPANYEGVKAQDDVPFVLRMANAWLEGMAGLNSNLEKTSNSSENTVSLPMETL